MTIDKKDEIILNFLHYFITEHSFEPLIVHGAENELWMQNVHHEFQIIRLVKHHIHNQEQYDFDQFKVKKVMDKMRFKTFTWHIKTLTIYLDLGENIEVKETKTQKSVLIKTKKDITLSDDLLKYFPSIIKQTKYTSDDLLNYIELTSEINNATAEKNQKLDNVFHSKTPFITNILIIMNVAVYAIALTYPALGTFIYERGVNVSHDVINFEYYRFLTAAFLHADIIHLGFNMYALYLLGPKIESYFGKIRFLIIYLTSAIGASMLSAIFLDKAVSLGASGAIFGLLAALAYFAYRYRIYMGNVLQKEIMPILGINLLISLIPGIDLAGHLGGFAMGLLITYAVGVNNDDKQNRLHGFIMVAIYLAFLIFLIK